MSFGIAGFFVLQQMNLTLFDNAATKSKYLPVCSCGKISLERRSRCFAQRMTAYRRLAPSDLINLTGRLVHDFEGKPLGFLSFLFLL